MPSEDTTVAPSVEVSDNLPTINIRGNDYVVVETRIEYVVAKYGGYNVVGVRQFSIGERYFYEIKLNINNHVYIGTSEIKFDGSGADLTNPMENSETSAIGRALGAANIGNVWNERPQNQRNSGQMQRR